MARFRALNLMAAHLERGERVHTLVPDGPMTPQHIRTDAATWCGQTMQTTSTTKTPTRTRCEACAVAYTAATGEPAGNPRGLTLSVEALEAHRAGA